MTIPTAPIVVALGEAVAEVMRPSVGLSLEQPGLFEGPFPSGAPAIFADAAARLGLDTGFIGCVGADAFGRAIKGRLARDGVNLACLRVDEARATGVGVALNAVSCLSTGACVAVGERGTVLGSSDGGKHWVDRALHSDLTLTAVSCAPGGICVATGATLGGYRNSTILVSKDAGAHWSVSMENLVTTLGGVSCSTSSQCVAVGDGGMVVAAASRVAPAASSAGPDDPSGFQLQLSDLPAGYALHAHTFGPPQDSSDGSVLFSWHQYDGSATSNLATIGCSITSYTSAAAARAAFIHIRPLGQQNIGVPQSTLPALAGIGEDRAAWGPTRSAPAAGDELLFYRGRYLVDITMAFEVSITPDELPFAAKLGHIVDQHIVQRK
jgi:hypothetical protein